MNLIVDSIALVVTGYLAYLALQFTATPKLRVALTASNGSGRLVFKRRERVNLTFLVENVGHWYAKPAATHIVAYVNLPMDAEASEARWGSQLHMVERMVGRGKGGAIYFKIAHIHLYHDEPGESISILTTMPSSAGTYECHLTLRSDEGDGGVHRFRFRVV